MASPQKEDGFTAIANEILVAMARTKLKPTQYRLLFVVWRYTYGFRKKTANLSLAFLASATGCDRRQIQRELKGLEQRRIIFQDTSQASARAIGFNKDYDRWVDHQANEAGGETDIGETAFGGNVVYEIDGGAVREINSSVGDMDDRAVGETGAAPLVKPSTNKDISLKKNSKKKEDLFNFPEEFWELRPYTL